jgi:hypothetical protein
MDLQRIRDELDGQIWNLQFVSMLREIRDGQFGTADLLASELFPESDVHTELSSLEDDSTPHYELFRAALIEGVRTATKCGEPWSEIYKWLEKWSLPFFDKSGLSSQEEAISRALELDGTGSYSNRYYEVTESGAVTDIRVRENIEDLEAAASKSGMIAFHIARCGMWQGDTPDTFIITNLCIVSGFNESQISQRESKIEDYEGDTETIFENVDAYLDIEGYSDLRPAFSPLSNVTVHSGPTTEGYRLKIVRG